MLDDRFDLLMTLEHLDESLLLLQQDLCWDMDEMFYLNRMVSKSQRWGWLHLILSQLNIIVFRIFDILLKRFEEEILTYFDEFLPMSSYMGANKLKFV